MAHTRILLVGLAFLVLASASLATGSHWIEPSALLRALLGTGEAADTLIVWSIRLPRLVLAALAGASLALAGAVLQGITRNGLADPGILGSPPGRGWGSPASSGCNRRASPPGRTGVLRWPSPVRRLRHPHRAGCTLQRRDRTGAPAPRGDRHERPDRCRHAGDRDGA